MLGSECLAQVAAVDRQLLHADPADQLDVQVQARAGLRARPCAKAVLFIACAGISGSDFDDRTHLLRTEADPADAWSRKSSGTAGQMCQVRSTFATEAAVLSGFFSSVASAVTRSWVRRTGTPEAVR